MYFHGINRQEVPNKSFFLYISLSRKPTTFLTHVYFFQSPFSIVSNPVRYSLIHAADYLVHVVDYLVHAVDYLVHAVN